MENNMTEQLSFITVIIMAIAALVYIIAGVISIRKTRKKEASDYQKFIESLKPDSVWTEKDIYRPLNPFEAYNPKTITIIEIRYNYEDAVWVRYQINDATTGIRAIKEDEAYNFYKVYKLTKA